MSLNKFSDENTGFDLKLNVGADAVKCNSLEADTLNVSNLTTETLEATTSIQTPQGDITNVESTNIDTDNINTTTINSQEYPQRQPPATSVFSLDMTKGTYNPLVISPNNPPNIGKGAVDYINLTGNFGDALEIATIEGGNYNGQRIRIINCRNGAGVITIKYNSPLANPTQGKFPIIPNGFVDKIVQGVSPVNFVWCDLTYVENYTAGVNVWVCSNLQT
jgi:hypothetical protein